MQTDKIDVDHFIPWSFLKDDNLWNLVLACPSCNRKKNDKLPDSKYIDVIIKRNQRLITVSGLPEMNNYQSRIIKYVYYWAKVNGYKNVWQP